METFLWVFAAMLSVSAVCAIASHLWFKFCWYVIGWRPKILDEAKVTKTVKECAASAVANDARFVEETQGYAMSEDEMHTHRVRVETAFRLVIERYIERFCQKI